MAYCPKCGVEVDNSMKNCPLCDFPIPNIETTETENKHRFPEFENIYPKRRRKIINRVFIILTVLIFSMVALLLYNNIHYSGSLSWARQTTVSLTATWFYLFFLFGYIPNFKKSVTGIGIVTIGLLFLLDSFDGRVSWFYNIGFEAVFLAWIFALFNEYLWKKSKRKGLNIVAYIMISASMYCVLLETCIDLYLYKEVNLLWSIDTVIQLVPSALLFIILNNVIPNKFIEDLKKKLHL